MLGWYLLLTWLYLGPLIVGIDSVVPHSIRDPGFQATVLYDVSERLLHLDFAHLYDASFFYPAHLTLAMADNQIGLQPIALPLQLITGDALLVLNLLTVLSFPVTAICGDALGRYVTHSRLGGLVVGTAFAFAAFRFEHVIHLQLLQSWTIALAYLGLEMTLREGDRRGPVLWAFALVATAATSLNYLLILAITQPVYLAVRLVVAADRGVAARNVLRLLMPGIVVFGIVALFAIPYVELASQGYTRRIGDTFMYSARPIDYLVPAADSLALHRLYQLHPPLTGIDERELFPGAIVAGSALLGVAIALVRSRWKWLRAALPWLIVIVVAFLLSLGPFLWPDSLNTPRTTHGLVPLPLRFLGGFVGSLRAPARFGVILLLGTAVLGAIGIVRTVTWLRAGWPRGLAVGMIAIAMAVEYSVSVPFAKVPWGPDLPPAYAWLRGQPPGPVAELPAIGVSISFSLLASTEDGHPRVNGWTGFTPFQSRPISRLVTAADFPNWLAAARRIGATYLIVHRSDVDAGTLSAVQRAGASGSLVHLGSFGTDDVYRFPSAGASSAAPPP